MYKKVGIIVLSGLTSLLVACQGQEKAEEPAYEETTSSKTVKESQTEQTTEEQTFEAESADVETKASQSEEKTTSEDTHPYSVALDSYRGVYSIPDKEKTINTWRTVDLFSTDDTHVTIAEQRGNPDSYETYLAEQAEIPTKTIRVFRKGEREPVIIKVNTQITLTEQVATSEGDVSQINTPQIMYVYHTNDGEVSLAAPNYAGNVPEEYSDVMQEFKWVSQ